MRADLHVHSTASDGTLSASELVALALERGLSVLSITDHDSVDAVEEACAQATGSPLRIVPAVELSSVHEGRDVHVLGYFVRPDDPHLREHLVDLRAARLRRAESMVAALRQAGYTLELEDVLALADGGAVGRSHVARALVASGHAIDMRDAFERLIGRERPFYIAKDVRSPRDVISVIRDAGGVAVLAHPGVSGLDDLIGELRASGIGGIEAYHADHTIEQRERYAEIARDAGLLATGGTDFHGPGAPNPQLGSVEIPAAAIEALLAWGDANA